MMKIHKATTTIADTKPKIFYAADLMASKAIKTPTMMTANPPTILSVVVP